MRAYAVGLYCAEAAVELLIGHRGWLSRPDFVDAFVAIERSADGAELACVDWATAVSALGAGQLPCSSGEAQMLRMAASIANAAPVGLREVLAGLDDDNIALVANAVLHASGRRDAGAELVGVQAL